VSLAKLGHNVRRGGKKNLTVFLAVVGHDGNQFGYGRRLELGPVLLDEKRLHPDA
jgi:hypothetical protein